MTHDEIKALEAIAEGYPVEGFQDRYIYVENPDYTPDNGEDPRLVIDTAALRQLTAPVGDAPDNTPAYFLALARENAALRAECNMWRVRCERAEEHMRDRDGDALECAEHCHAVTFMAERDALREALAPSGDTKAAYHGEFSFARTYYDEDDEEQHTQVYVPWDTTKEIMKAISARAALAPPAQASAPGPMRVPDGWQLVPKEPTEAMLNAELGLRHWDKLPSYESRRDLRPHIWKAMIAAAGSRDDG